MTFFLCHNIFMKNNRATILGFEVDLMRFDEALDYITEKSENQSTQTITINPEMMALGDKNEEFANILKTADLVIPDGFGVKLGLKIKGIEQERIPGIEFAKKLIGYCAENNLPIALLGAKEEVLEGACVNLSKEFPNLNIAYKRNGYFKEEDEKGITEELKSANPKLVLVALGIPKQEIFIRSILPDFQNTMFIGVGGSFDVWSGKTKRAPLFFRKIGCEWLWRLIKEPSRFNRMFPTLPLFLFRVIIEKIRNV